MNINVHICECTIDTYLLMMHTHMKIAACINLLEMREDGDIDKAYSRKRKGELGAKFEEVEQDIANLSPKAAPVKAIDFSSRMDYLKTRLGEYVNFEGNSISESVIEAFIEKIWVAKNEFRWFLRSGEDTVVECSAREK